MGTKEKRQNFELKYEFNNNNFKRLFMFNDMSDIKVSGGYLYANIDGIHPYMYNCNNLNLSSSIRYLTIRLRNNTNGTKVKIRWITNQDNFYSDNRTLEFNIIANDPSYRTYCVDLGDNKNWIDVIKKKKKSRLA
jgi:hypothetical protein